jgi:mono/diheme cytochrome c family protein
MKKTLLLSLLLVTAGGYLLLPSCSKSGGGGGGGTPDKCAGVTITVNATATIATAGQSDATISVTASGSTGFTYRLNSGGFQSSASFTGIPAGTYTITAKDANGCTGTATVTVTETDPCAGATFTVSANTTQSQPCSATGSITAVVNNPGAATYSFSLNGGAFQPGAIFNNVAAGNNTLRVTDGTACVRVSTVNVPTIPNGPLFNAVRGLINTNCIGCHTNGNANGGANFDSDCNVVALRDRIKARAVDASPSAMPPTGLLPASERSKITNWINAGGRTTD